MKTIYRFLVFLFLCVGFAWSVNAQTDQVQETVIEGSEYFFSEEEALTYRERYMQCGKELDLQGKIHLSEEIGEQGAERFCQKQGWNPLLRKYDKAPNHPQGVDQVWQDSNGKFHVIEAKGIAKGDSPHLPKNRFGHDEGTAEWVIDTLQDTLKSNSANETEKRVARQTLEATRKGDMYVQVICTKHVYGKPEESVWYSPKPCSQEASRMASRVIESPVYNTPARTAKIHNGAAARKFGSILCGDFHKGQRIDFSLADNLSHSERLKKAIGINETTLKKAGSAANYIRKRGVSTIAGKLFEESYVRKFQREFTRKNPDFRLENTAMLGKPHDPADLVLTRRGIVIEKYQQKLSRAEAIKALRESKYMDCKILIPCDVYQELKLSKTRLVREAIQSGRLTNRVLGISTETAVRYKKETDLFVRNIYRAAVPTIASSSTLNVLSSAWDLGRGIQLMYSAHTNYRTQMLDRDIAQAKLFLGFVDSLAGITGISLAFIPVVGEVGIAVTGTVAILIEGGDAFLMWIQKRRYENQKKLILHLKAEDRPDAIRRLILRNIE